MIELDHSSATKLYQQIYNQICAYIDKGLLKPGVKLTLIRKLAEDIGCSRNTVETAYRLLVQEGYASGRAGSGYFVLGMNFFGSRCFIHADPNEMRSQTESGEEFIYDFGYGNLEQGTFPSSQWRMLTNQVLMESDRFAGDMYPDPLGLPELRFQITRQLNATKNMHCKPDQVVVQSGAEQGIRNLMALFDRDKDTVLMEEPGYNKVREAFIQSGFRVKPVSVEEGTRAYIDAVESSGAKMLFATPSCQFPTCNVMDVSIRKRLIDWTLAADSYILEDDYCHELRYRQETLPAIASMDDVSRTVYMGTFSKTLSPSLRISYLVLPENVLERWKRVYSHSHSSVPWLHQAVLARFIDTGQWDRHLRNLSLANRRKFESITSSIELEMGQRVALRSSGSGLHLLLDVLGGRTQEELVWLAKQSKVKVEPTNIYYMNGQSRTSCNVMLGFSATSEKEIAPGIHALKCAWFG